MSWTPVSSMFDDPGAINALVYSGDLGNFLAGGVGASSKVIGSSIDGGATWTPETTPLDGGVIYGLAWSSAQALFVAVGYDAGGLPPTVMHSPDGSTWTAASVVGAMNTVFGVAYSAAQDMWIAVGGGGGDPAAMTSPDGDVWTDQAGAGTDSATGIAYSPNLDLWVMALAGATTNLQTSPDGVTWTPRSSDFDGASGYATSVIWSTVLDIFVAVGKSNGGSAVLATSPDGIAWTTQSYPGGIGLVVAEAVATGVVMVGGFSPPDSLTQSVDGITWVPITNPFDNFVQALAFSPANRWVIGGGIDALPERSVFGAPDPLPTASTQYQRIYGWRANIADDGTETLDPLLTSPQVGS